MVVLTRAQVIGKPIGEVFATVIDGGNYAAWNPTIKASRRLDEGEIREGSRFAWKLRGFGEVTQELREFRRNNSLKLVSSEHVERILDEHEDVAFGNEALLARRRPHSDEGLPKMTRCTIAAGLAVASADLPPSLLAELKHLASLHNPLFYERQRLRLSTH